MMTLAPPIASRALTKEEVAEIRLAIMNAYREREFRRILNDHLGFDIENYINVKQAWFEMLDDLVQEFDREGRGLELLALAWSQKPGNPSLRPLGERLLGAVGPILARYDRQARIANAPSVNVDSDAALEKLVTSRSPLILFSDYQRRLKEIGRAICLIQTPTMIGTGFLVGERSVLTNYHVIKEAKQSGLDGREIRCTFDFELANADGDILGTSVTAAEGTEWLLDWKPYSESDLTGIGDPGPDELDYALLRLGEVVPGARGPLSLPASATVVAPLDIAMIIQHPGGHALSLAMGVITDFPGSGLRYRYNTTTESGSSGSPVFSVNLDLIGLHHAADPRTEPRYNQSVPLWRIAGALAAASKLADL